MRRLVVPAFVLLVACGTAPAVRPLGAGRGAVEASVGGPVIGPVGAPAPVVIAGYRHGLDDRSDVFGRLHVVPAVVGVLGLEAGASRLLFRGGGYAPALGGSVQGLFFAGPGGGFAVPAVSFNASWAPGRWILYAGTEEAVSFGTMLEGDDPLFHWAPYVGATRDVGRWTFGAELRWWEPHLGSDVLVWWQGIGGRGALVPMISIARRVGGDR